MTAQSGLFFLGLAGLSVFIFLLSLALTSIQQWRINEKVEEGRRNRFGTYLRCAAIFVWRFLRGPVPAARTDWLKKLIDISTLAVIAFGLYFAYDQAKKLAEAIESTTWNNVTTQELAVYKIFVDNPRDKKYSYRGFVINKNDDEYDHVVSIAELILDFMDMYFSSEDHLSTRASDPKKWYAYFNYVFEHSPITRDVLKEHVDEYNDRLASGAAGSCCRFDGWWCQRLGL